MKNLTLSIAAVFCVLLLSLPCSAQEIGSGGISWWQLTRLSPDTVYGAYGPTIATQGDTLHLTWKNSSLNFPYVRSTDNGVSFEPIRELVPDSLGRVGLSWVVSGGNRIHGFFEAHWLDSSINAWRWFYYHLYSTDRGDSWSVPHQFPENMTIRPNGMSAWGDTVAMMVTLPDGYAVVVSTDGGDTWSVPPTRFQGEHPQVRITPGALHYGEGGSYDSAGQFTEFVAVYRRSTDLGQTWSDPFPVSTMQTEVTDLSISVDPTGGIDSSRVFIVWDDAKNGCLTLDGCSTLGRISNDNGRTFEPERRYDKRQATVFANSALSGNTMAITWGDNFPDWAAMAMVTVSTDRGITWTEPYAISDTAVGRIAIAGNTIHVVVEKLVGDVTVDPRFHTFYRRGVLPTSGSDSAFIYPAGWNLLALPSLAPDLRASVVYPYSTVFAYDNGYLPADSLAIGKGYWVKLDKYHRQFNFPVTGVSPETLRIQPGWNIIGQTTGGNIPVAALSAVPDQQLSPFFGFHKGYAASDTLLKGQGYWVRAESEGTLIIGGSSAARKPVISAAGMNNRSRLTITDGAGGAQTLYFGDSPGANAWMLPPPPPEGLFDCRFADGTCAAAAGSMKPAVIALRNAVDPVTVSWDCTAAAPAAELIVDGSAIPLLGTGSTRIAHARSELAIRFANRSQPVPQRFTLEQNYPNPFNPVTRIRYTLPEPGTVTLKIYDLFGREIAAPATGTKPAGEHSVEWDGSAFASGVYFYRLQFQSAAGGKSFSAVKRMLLIR